MTEHETMFRTDHPTHPLLISVASLPPVDYRQRFHVIVAREASPWAVRWMSSNTYSVEVYGPAGSAGPEGVPVDPGDVAEMVLDSLMEYADYGADAFIDRRLDDPRVAIRRDLTEWFEELAADLSRLRAATEIVLDASLHESLALSKLPDDVPTD